MMFYKPVIINRTPTVLKGNFRTNIIGTLHSTDEYDEETTFARYTSMHWSPQETDVSKGSGVPIGTPVGNLDFRRISNGRRVLRNLTAHLRAPVGSLAEGAGASMHRSVTGRDRNVHDVSKTKWKPEGCCGTPVGTGGQREQNGHL